MREPWRVAVFTSGRQDYGILRSTIKSLAGCPDITPLIYVGGMHLSPRFGRTVSFLQADGVPIARELPFIAEPPDPVPDAARALESIGAALSADRPDVMLLVGDRFETAAAGIASGIARVPLAHLHGGEETEGSSDNAYRHALTKLSHLHLVSLQAYGDRVIQMGEDPARVVVVGAPGLDNLYRDDLPDREGLEHELGVPLVEPVVIVTVHPETLSGAPNLATSTAVAAALEQVRGTCVVTQANADPGGVEIAGFWDQWSRGRENVVVRQALGERAYWALLKIASAMVGNSSSGIIEAPAARLPSVNVGDRQRGRVRSAYTLDVSAVPDAVGHALATVLDPASRIRLAGAPLPFPEGPAAPRVIAALRDWLPRRATRKTFYSAS